MGDRQPADPDSLAQRFFREARRVLLKESARLAFDATDVLHIAQDPAMQGEFRELFRNEVNNPQLAQLITDYLADFASDLESSAKISDIKVDLIDRAGIAVAASATVGAIGMVVVSGGTIGSILLLAGGLIGLAATGTSRTVLKLNSHKSAVAAERVRRLAGTLKAHDP
jgi:hypothetical protein